MLQRICIHRENIVLRVRWVAAAQILLQLGFSACVAAPARSESIYEQYRFQLYAGGAGNEINCRDSDGYRTLATICHPAGIVVDKQDNIYLTEPDSQTIRKISADTGMVTTLTGSFHVTGTTDGVGTAAQFSHPEGIAIDAAGNLYVTDTWAATIRKIRPDGTVTTLAGVPWEHADVDGSLRNARFDYPHTIAVDREGNIYVGEMDSDKIRKISTNGMVSTVATLFQILALAVDSHGTVFVVAESTLWKLGPEGAVTVAGPYVFGSNDGPGEQAHFNSPSGIAVDASDNIYVADTFNRTVRKVTPSGFVTTIGGWVDHPSFVSGTGASARFYHPNAVAMGGDGRVYVTDGVNGAVTIGGPGRVPQSLNLSTRVRVEGGDGALIGGFIANRPFQKRVLIRALGPSTASSGINNFLVDPVLELHDSSSVIVATNDDWKQTQQAQIDLTGLPPTNERESALVATLEPYRAYTAVVRGKNGGTGVALVEMYDLNSSSGSVLANVSTRARVSTGDNVMIGGVIIGPQTTMASSVLVRALGPSLSALGVNDALFDPTLELHDGHGVLIASNDDWKVPSQNPTTLRQDLRPTDDRESALALSLGPGGYTAVVRGKNNTTGIALIEIYDLN